MGKEHQLNFSDMSDGAALLCQINANADTLLMLGLK